MLPPDPAGEITTLLRPVSGTPLPNLHPFDAFGDSISAPDFSTYGPDRVVVVFIDTLTTVAVDETCILAIKNPIYAS